MVRYDTIVFFYDTLNDGLILYFLSHTVDTNVEKFYGEVISTTSVASVSATWRLHLNGNCDRELSLNAGCDCLRTTASQSSITQLWGPGVTPSPWNVGFTNLIKSGYS